MGLEPYSGEEGGQKSHFFAKGLRGKRERERSLFQMDGAFFFSPLPPLPLSPSTPISLLIDGTTLLPCDHPPSTRSYPCSFFEAVVEIEAEKGGENTINSPLECAVSQSF